LGKKRIMGVSCDSPPATGAAIMAGERTAGVVLSTSGDQALALMRHEFCAQPLTLAEGEVRIVADPDAPQG